MKPARLILAALLALGLLGLAAYYHSRSPQTSRLRFATPSECVDAYAEACRDGDVGRFRATLAEPFRSQSLDGLTESGEQAEAVRLRLVGVKSWVQRGQPAIDGDEATVDVEEVREEGARRIRFYLKRVAGGWQITKIGEPEAVDTPFRYGTRDAGPGK